MLAAAVALAVVLVDQEAVERAVMAALRLRLPGLRILVAAAVVRVMPQAGLAAPALSSSAIARVI